MGRGDDTRGYRNNYGGGNNNYCGDEKPKQPSTRQDFVPQLKPCQSKSKASSEILVQFLFRVSLLQA